MSGGPRFRKQEKIGPDEAVTLFLNIRVRRPTMCGVENAGGPQTHVPSQSSDPLTCSVPGLSSKRANLCCSYATKSSVQIASNKQNVTRGQAPQMLDRVSPPLVDDPVLSGSMRPMQGGQDKAEAARGNPQNYLLGSANRTAAC